MSKNLIVGDYPFHADFRDPLTQIENRDHPYNLTLIHSLNYLNLTMVTRLLSSLKIFLFYAVAVGAFSPVERGNLLHRSALCSVQPTTDARDPESVKMPNRSDFLAVVGSFVTGAIVSRVQPAEAVVTANPCKWAIERQLD